MHQEPQTAIAGPSSAWASTSLAPPSPTRSTASHQTSRSTFSHQPSPSSQRSPGSGRTPSTSSSKATGTGMTGKVKTEREEVDDFAKPRLRCDHPGCTKSFLRREHLVRHQLNHSQSEKFQCTECPKHFYRADLLKRHIERHARGLWFRRSGNWSASRAEAMLPSSSRDQSDSTSSGGPSPESLASTGSGPTPSSEMASMESPVAPSALAQPGRFLSPVPEQVAPSSPYPAQWSAGLPHLLPFDQSAVTVPMFSNCMSDSICTMSQFIPTGIDPLNWMFDRDPAAGTPETQSPSLVRSLHSQTNALPSLGTRHVNGLPPMAVFLDPPDSAVTPALNVWIPVAQALLTDLADPSLYDHPFFAPVEMQTNFDSYFRSFQDHFPILSRPTTQPGQSHHLLLATIISLGASMGSDADYDVARRIHDRIRTLLFSHSSFMPCTLWVLQALLLNAAFGKMISTRTHYSLAQVFHSSIITLMRVGRTLSPQTASAPTSDSIEARWRAWVDEESSKRTAFFAFLVDIQHAVLFGHTPLLRTEEIDLALPCSEALWECEDAVKWASLPRPEPPSFRRTLKNLIQGQPMPSFIGYFSPFILLHGLMSVSVHLSERQALVSALDLRRPRLVSPPQGGEVTAVSSPDVGAGDDLTDETREWRSMLLLATHGWRDRVCTAAFLPPERDFALQAGAALQHVCVISVTSIRLNDLHIFAGGPSLLCQLVGQRDIALARTAVVNWTFSTFAWAGVLRAVEVLQETLFGEKTGFRVYRARDDKIVARIWSVYYATLVLWAYSVVIEGPDHAPYAPNDLRTVESYLVWMRQCFNSPQTSTQVQGINRVSPLISVVSTALRGHRWELLDEASRTLDGLLRR